MRTQQRLSLPLKLVLLLSGFGIGLGVASQFLFQADGNRDLQHFVALLIAGMLGLALASLLIQRNRHRRHVDQAKSPSDHWTLAAIYWGCAFVLGWLSISLLN